MSSCLFGRGLCFVAKTFCLFVHCVLDGSPEVPHRTVDAERKEVTSWARACVEAEDGRWTYAERL